jgi:hypothetical protein
VNPPYRVGHKGDYHGHTIQMCYRYLLASRLRSRRRNTRRTIRVRHRVPSPPGIAHSSVHFNFRITHCSSVTPLIHTRTGDCTGVWAHFIPTAAAGGQQ